MSFIQEQRLLMRSTADLFTDSQRELRRLIVCEDDHRLDVGLLNADYKRHRDREIER